MRSAGKGAPACGLQPLPQPLGPLRPPLVAPPVSDHLFLAPREREPGVGAGAAAAAAAAEAAAAAATAAAGGGRGHPRRARRRK